MSAQERAIITGSIFFVLRLLLCILLVVISFTADSNDWKGTNFEFMPPIVWAILIGIGAFTDLFLVFGAWKKNICAIHFWCFAQIIVGGIPCCFAIPLVAMKAVQEIKDEKDCLPTTQFQFGQGSVAYSVP